MSDRPHVHLDVSAALAGEPSLTTDASRQGPLTGDAALALSEDLRSAALVAAQLGHERDTLAGYTPARDLVQGSGPAIDDEPPF